MFTVADILDDVEDLTRRQVTSTLGGLACYGLSGQLDNVTDDEWMYATDDAVFEVVDDSHRQYKPPAGAPREVPVGWNSNITVISRKRIAGREFSYVVKSADGVLLEMQVIDSIESLTPHWADRAVGN